MSVTYGIVGAGAIAFVVAYAELLARYRDDPVRAVLSWPAATYGIVNAASGVLAAWWLWTFFPQLVAVATPAAKVNCAEPNVAKLAVVAGLGSLALLRTSLLKLRMTNGDDISVGPAVIVEQIMSVVDRGVDRHQAQHRSEIAKSLAPNVNFDQQAASLVSLCLVLLQNPSADEEQQITSVMRSLAGRSDISPKVKSMSLLLTLLGLVGEPVLRNAVDALNGPAPTPAATP